MEKSSQRERERGKKKEREWTVRNTATTKKGCSQRGPAQKSNLVREREQAKPSKAAVIQPCSHQTTQLQQSIVTAASHFLYVYQYRAMSGTKRKKPSYETNLALAFALTAKVPCFFLLSAMRRPKARRGHAPPRSQRHARHIFHQAATHRKKSCSPPPDRFRVIYLQKCVL